jgi:hypothetical protein
MKFRIVFSDVLPCKIISTDVSEVRVASETPGNNYFTRQYIPEDNSELQIIRRSTNTMGTAFNKQRAIKISVVIYNLYLIQDKTTNP